MDKGKMKNYDINKLEREIEILKENNNLKDDVRNRKRITECENEIKEIRSLLKRYIQVEQCVVGTKWIVVMSSEINEDIAGDKIDNELINIFYNDVIKDNNCVKSNIENSALIFYPKQGPLKIYIGTEIIKGDFI